VFLLADDLGYGDLGCTGHPYAKTPAIDRLAKDGTLCHNFYVAGATCCPSRTGLMTSRFPASFQKYPASFGFSGAVTVTDLLKRNGYRTGHFGRWHMGDEQTNGTFGLGTIQVLKGNLRDPRGRDAEIADAAIDFITANKDGPFYVNVWFHTPHNPVRPPKAFADRFAGVTVKRADFPNPDLWAFFDLYEKLGGNLNDGMRNYLGDVSQLTTRSAGCWRSSTVWGCGTTPSSCSPATTAPATGRGGTRATRPGAGGRRTRWGRPGRCGSGSSACTTAASGGRSSSAGRGACPPAGWTRRRSPPGSTGSPPFAPLPG
jgi:N-acetylgalactosamine-6-sulfatase